MVTKFNGNENLHVKFAEPTHLERAQILKITKFNANFMSLFALVTLFVRELKLVGNLLMFNIESPRTSVCCLVTLRTQHTQSAIKSRPRQSVGRSCSAGKET